MRRNDDIELFSMSFLDLISCAMAGVLVLYTVADRDPSQGKAKEVQRSSITLTFQDQKVGRLGYSVKLINGSNTYVGSSTGQTGRWIFRDNPMSARLSLVEPLRQGAVILVYIEDFDIGKDQSKAIGPVNLNVIVTSSSSSKPFNSFSMTLHPETYHAEHKF